jgi:translation elongation factor EF-4
VVLRSERGGDISRKRKLLDKQKEGTKRMWNRIGVSPHKGFVAALRIGEERVCSSHPGIKA